MNIRDKVKDKKKDLEALVAEERMIRSSIEELKMLAKQVKTKKEAIKELEKEQERLLKELEG